MAPMSEEQYRKGRARLRDRMLRLLLWKVRDMHLKYSGRPRATRADKHERALRQLTAAIHGETKSQSGDAKPCRRGRTSRRGKA